VSMSAVKFFRVNIIIIIIIILFLSFRRVLNVIYSFLGNSPASEFRRRGITQKGINYK